MGLNNVSLPNAIAAKIRVPARRGDRSQAGKNPRLMADVSDTALLAPPSGQYVGRHRRRRTEEPGR